jgi:hypothetical protein
MKEILPNLFIGNDADVVEFQDLHPEGAIIHAAKEKWHREALGYTGRGAPKDHPEYLVAERGDELMLNLVDCPKPQFIPRLCFDEAFNFFSKHHLVDERPILIHCNQGKSRAPGVLLYCLEKSGYFDETACSGSFELMVDWLEDEQGYEPEFGDGVYLALTEWIDG